MGYRIVGYGTGVLGAALALQPGVAAAQEAPPAAERVTELSVNANIRHDSNVARSDATIAALRGLTQADTRLTPSISARIARPLGRNSLSLQASAGYDFYAKNKRLNRERLSAAAAVGLAAGPCDVRLLPTYARRQSDLGETALGALVGTESVKNTETVQSYRGELYCGRIFTLRPYAYAEHNRGSNSNPILQQSDFRGKKFGGGLSFDNPIVGQLRLNYSHDRTDYPRRPVLTGNSGYSIDQFGGSISRQIGAILQGTASLNLTRLQPDQGATRRFNGLTYSLDATATPTPDLELQGGFSRSVQPAFGFDAAYQVKQQYSLDATYGLSSRIKLSVGGTIQKSEYQGASANFGRVLANETRKSARGSLDFGFIRRVRFTLEGGYEKRDANGSYYDYDNVYFGLRTRLTL